MAMFPGDPADIVGVGLCTIRFCRAMLRADGSLVEPVMSWMDDRASQPYLPDDPTSPTSPRLPGYVAHRLTGGFERHGGERLELQWPIDTDTGSWSDDGAVRAVGVRRDMLFELRCPGEVIGPLTAAAAAATGLPAGVPVVATANDKAVEMLGCGLVGPTAALVSLGTYIAAMVTAANHRTRSTSGPTTRASRPLPVREPRRAPRDVDGELAARPARRRARRAGRALGLSARSHGTRGATVPAGSDGLMTVLDWLAPTDGPYRKGVMLGFDARHTAATCTGRSSRGSR